MLLLRDPFDGGAAVIEVRLVAEMSGSQGSESERNTDAAGYDVTPFAVRYDLVPTPRGGQMWGRDCRGGQVTTAGKKA